MSQPTSAVEATSTSTALPSPAPPTQPPTTTVTRLPRVTQTPSPTLSLSETPTVSPTISTLTPHIESPTVGPTPGGILTLEQQMVRAVNAQRRSRGLPPYAIDDQLSLVARLHSQDMVRRGYFDHVTPEGTTLRGRLRRAGIAARWAGENIQRNSQAGEQAVAYAMEWFMQSTLHRKNILHQHYTHIGVGAVRDEETNMTTFVLVFAQLSLE